MGDFEKQIILLDLYQKNNDLLVFKFLDLRSKKMLDEKIEVLTKLNAGINPEDIENYYDILELYPTDDRLWN